VSDAGLVLAQSCACDEYDAETLRQLFHTWMLQPTSHGTRRWTPRPDGSATEWKLTRVPTPCLFYVVGTRQATMPDGDASKAWLDRWANIQTTCASRQDFLDHMALIAAVDWPSTSLGPIASWSNALKSAVGQCLAAPFPSLLAWGPELIMIYNQHYAESVHQKHPRILGMPYKDAWPEVWSSLAPATSAALAGKVSHAHAVQMFLVRSGYTEECYFDWSVI
jgi:hypothetical protein